MKRSAKKRKRFKAMRQHSIEGSSGGGSAARKAQKMAGGTKADRPLKAKWMYDPKAAHRRFLKSKKRMDSDAHS